DDIEDDPVLDPVGPAPVELRQPPDAFQRQFAHVEVITLILGVDRCGEAVAVPATLGLVPRVIDRHAAMLGIGKRHDYPGQAASPSRASARLSVRGDTWKLFATSAMLPPLSFCSAARARATFLALNLRGRPKVLPRRLAASICARVRREITARSYSAHEAVSIYHLRPSGVRVSMCCVSERNVMPLFIRSSRK